MLSAKAKYGLKAMTYLADRECAGGIQGAEIAETQHIPKKFLDTILLDLKNHGLINSKKGKGGGYSLARPASRITVGQIVRILNGSLALLPCLDETARKPCTDCGDESTCRVRRVMSKAGAAIAEILDETSLRDMAGSNGTRSPILHYDI